MALHALVSVTVGVPDVDASARFYEEFGLTPAGRGRFETTDGGEQLTLVESPRRRLVELTVASDAPIDLPVIATRLRSLGAEPVIGEHLCAVDPTTGTGIVVKVWPPRPPSPPRERVAVNGPGRTEPTNARADAVLRREPVRVRRLSHVVLGSPDAAATERVFVQGLGFEVSDRIPGVGAFLRCSTDHHNVFVQEAPVAFLHHTSWLVDDVDELGRGGSHLVERDPACHVWGPGRHHIGSNYFWYLRDPAGNFAEYSADLDVIDDGPAWRAEDVTGREAIMSWAPPVPMSFLVPDDLEPAS